MGTEMKTVGFAAAVCLACSLLLAAVYSGLKEEQDRNKKTDLKVKVLKTFGLDVTDSKGKPIRPLAEMEAIFESQVKGMVLDSGGREVAGMRVEELTGEQINERDKNTGLKQYYPLYIYTDKESGRKLYAIHISGMGLWSVVKGFLALNDDLSSIAGVAFYQHGETPGLGGEIDRNDFQERFKNKILAQNGAPQFFKILKPGEKTGDSSINGISGATMTCKGLMGFINKDFEVYNKHFQTMGN